MKNSVIGPFCFRRVIKKTLLTEAGVRVFRHTAREDHPRGIFCAIGRCTDCAMTVNGVPGVRTCITRVEEGMRVETQHGLGKWGDPHA